MFWLVYLTSEMEKGQRLRACATDGMDELSRNNVHLGTDSASLSHQFTGCVLGPDCLTEPAGCEQVSASTA
jgi:hypothetical protein